ncbi:phenylalanine--tRNA ligase subunit beta [Alteromonas lipolytica]|uniref:Phenylalanine--tRNA ligase beta subunit n=1 Tax=Alteromonas lipolytica TaxID=1856405 RepID=A0A1E8FKI0_9ALTE|nr:phenylalanine--tRNA ligase subunit beta [Alteromonas lipolytica]OFI36414.1 phenylalanine--tRNA ligase subunit beta [Alteromonas lipolytica]GGF70104.1 phenylalanine--tRNA ligase beta subunit [Alteromonas lipolytica]
MKFSEKWLREWVNPAVSRDELCEQLSMAGLEVDGVEPVAGDFSGVVIGEVVECGQHPNADKLRVTKINVGEDELLDIVCGAPNCRAGLKVAVAKVGAVLPGDFKIKKAKLRGEPSFGMLCSYSELGVSDDHSGIIELALDAPVGADVREYLGLDDVTIEVDLTPNRADCLGLRGIAREVGVLNKADVCEPEIAPVAATIDDKLAITLSAPQACSRYLGRVIKGVDVKAESPLWLTEKLRRSGIRNIDPIVDVTNFVLLELGHPMHAFNLASIDGGINVRMAEAGEKLVLLDESEVELKDNTLVIADDNKALAMAGIFGGLHSGTDENTTDILLESAFFHPDTIMGKARQYGLHTDASHRYERGVDPQLQATAMERATQLILDICGGQAGPVVEAVSEADIPVRAEVTLRKARLAKVLGIDIPAATVSEILARLGLDAKESDEGWVATAPSYRFDIEIEEDLIEEVARVYGYNSIANQAPVAALAMIPASEKELSVNAVKSVLLNRGYNEAITYSFVDPKVQNALFPESNGLVLPHPISADMSIMRVSLWPGLLQATSYNQKRQQQRIRLFETGLRFIPDADAPNGINQQPMLAGVVAGRRFDEHWDRDDKPVDFFDAKADVEALLALTAKEKTVTFNTETHSALHPGMSAAVYMDDKCVGWLGAVHPQFSKQLGTNGRVFVFEIELAALTNRELPQAQPVSKYPANRRDIAITVAADVKVGDIINFVGKIGVNQLVGLNLFDVYTGQGIADGYKSLALSLILQDPGKTLEDAEIQAAVDSVIRGLESEFGAALRE